MKTNSRLLSILIILILLATSCKDSTNQTNQSHQIVTVPVESPTCREFNDYIIETGVSVNVANIDPNEQPIVGSRPKRAGTTAAQEAAGIREGSVSISTETVQKIRCGCTGQLFDDATSCTNACRASLGCFTNICEPVTVSTRVCATEHIDVVFKFTATIFRVDWHPPIQVPNACKNEIAQWNQSVETHELAHYKIVEDMVKSYNEMWKNGESFTACANTESEARQKLAEQIQAFQDGALSDDLDQLDADIAQKQKEFHGNAGETVEQLDCSVCP